MRVIDRFIKPDSSLKKADYVERWQGRIQRCVQKRSKQEYNWARWAAIMDDNLWLDARLSDGTKPSQVNELKSSIMTIIPHILVEPPVIEVRAYSMEDTELAAIYERVAKFLDKQYDLFSVFTTLVYDALLYGNGIAKVGYWDDVYIDRPIWPEGLTEPFGMRKTVAVTQNPLIEIYPDFSAVEWNRQRYLLHKVAAHIDDIRSNDQYSKSAVNKLSPSLSSEKLFEMDYNSDGGKVVEMEPEYVPLWEIHSFPQSEVVIIADGANDWLYRGPEPYSISPYVNLEFFQRPKSVWGDSLTQSVEQHIKELGEVNTWLGRAVAKAGVLKILLRAAEWDEEQIKQLRDTEDSYISLTAEDLANSAKPLDLNITKDQYIFQVAEAQIVEQIRRISGVTVQEMGGHERGVETKAEAMMLKTASEVKNLWRQRIFSRFASKIIAKMLYIVSLEMPPERIAAMAGLQPFWAYPIAQAGPFSERRFVVDYGMTAANSRNRRLEKLMMFQQLVGPYINPVVLAKMATDALDFDFAEELMVYSALGMGSNPNTPALRPEQQNMAAQVAATRVGPPQQALPPAGIPGV